MRRFLKVFPLLVALAVAASACATEANPDTASIDVAGDGLDSSSDPSAGVDQAISPTTGLTGANAPTSDEVVTAALTDVNDFWQRTYQDLYGATYEPISGGFWPYGPNTQQPPCGQPAPSYRDIAQNAFYCPEGDLIAWDDASLIPDLYDQFGGFTIGIVFAHEFGHAIQTRAGTQGDTVVLELQADCFAGAWARDVEEGNSKRFELSVDDLDKAVAGFLALRDGVGISASHPSAHGTGFDRIGSFADGYQLGVEQCAGYPEAAARGDLVVVEVPFSDPADYQRGGNLPLADLMPSLLEDLDNFWRAQFDAQGLDWTPVADVVPVDPRVDEVACGDKTLAGDVLVNASFYCVDDDKIYIDDVHLIPALNDIGDYAVATEIARQYAYAVLARIGIDGRSLATNRDADCLAGAYAQSGFVADRKDSGQTLYLSPGDLDEAVIAFLFTRDATGAGDVSVSTAFQRFGAYRDGFLSGLPACNALLDEG